MAVGVGGVRVASASASAAEVWGRKQAAATGMPARRRGAAAIRCGIAGGAAGATAASGGLQAEEHYRTLRLRSGATRDEVKKAYRGLTLMYHPDVCKESDGGAQFQRINLAYQMVMSDMREAEERLEYWRLKYGLTDADLDKYRYYLNEDDDDDWFDV